MRQEPTGAQVREARFHDDLAAGLDPAVMAPRPPDEWEWSILRAAAPLDGADVLDLGCGSGDLGLQLVDAGARSATLLDISPGMVDVARARFARFRPDADARFVVAPVERTGLADESVDVVVGKWILHHVELGDALREIARILRPGGRAVFIETSGLNPVLRLARRYATGRLGVARVGTPDERPLGRRELETIESAFPGSVVDFPNFFLLRIFDRNVLRFRFARVTRTLYGWDRALERRANGGARRLGRASYYLRITARK